MIEPLQILFEIVYTFSNEIIQNSGLTIIVLSLVMNFLVLPLYKRADAMQEEQREIEKKLEKGVGHIKKTFKGDERMMMLQTYYRQNNYKPVYALKSAASLLLQIPFFIAAYRFLSTLGSLSGASLGFITDLSKPDGLFTAFGLSINILPILMTSINLISSFIYSKDYPAKTKIQLFAMAAFFLVFLYNSPSGLVFYWTLNNLFSLVKTIILKTKEPAKRAVQFSSALGIAALVFALLFKNRIEYYFAIILAVAVGAQLPLLIYRLKVIRSKQNKNDNTKSAKQLKPDNKLFICCTLFMTAFLGLYIPSNVIASSPQDFVFLNNFIHPIWYVVSSFCIAFGTFVIWFGIFYYFAKDSKRVLFNRLMLIICICSVINYMAFGKHTGIMNYSLAFTTGFFVYKGELLLNIAVLLLIIIIIFIVYKYVRKYSKGVIIVALIAFVAVSSYNSANIIKSVAEVDRNKDAEEFNITLSKDKENVVFIMLDRAMGEYVPYIFNEKPELKSSFDGFTYYSNVISYGKSTNFGSPALFGGYEYTAIELNTKSSQTLVEKQNEALKVMPVIFDNNGYDVTVCNPTYAEYKIIPDLSIYDDYPDISAYNVTDSFVDPELLLKNLNNNKRNFFVFSIMKTSPIFLQPYIYMNGSYGHGGDVQIAKDQFVASGNNMDFLMPYSVLSTLSDITDVTSDSNCFLFLTNDTTHNPQMLQAPDYVPTENVDNTEYYNENKELYNINGVELKFDNVSQAEHYESNMASFVQLAKWFDYLKEEGVYDNTRIILAADHGAGFNQIEDLIYEYNMDEEANLGDLSYYFPLLMVKDFNATGFIVSDEFMTNADVPTIAFDGLIDNPVNPSTGNLITNAAKYNGNQYIISSPYFSIVDNNGNQFLPGKWYSVHDNIWDKNNWNIVAEDAVLTEEDVERIESQDKDNN